MRFFLDLDGTLAKWGIISSEEELFEQGYFRNLPYESALIRETKMLVDANIPVYILSHYLPNSKYAELEKIDWVHEYLPDIPNENILLLPCGTSKAEFVLKKLELESLSFDDYLVDDYSANLFDWIAHGGVGVKFMNGINGTKGTWQGQKICAMPSNKAETLYGCAINALLKECNIRILCLEYMEEPHRCFLEGCCGDGYFDTFIDLSPDSLYGLYDSNYSVKPIRDMVDLIEQHCEELFEEESA